MEILEIKNKLPFSQVLEHYSLQPKNNMLNCPFHKDNTASLQVNLEKHYYKCHACGKTGDQIQWVQDYEKLSKHEAIVKCASLVEGHKVQSQKSVPIAYSLPPAAFLEKMYQSFRKGIFSSPSAKEYCKQRNLNIETLQIGFNGGQFHHGTRKDETLIHNCLAVGLLSPAGTNSRTGGQAYKAFGNKGIVFPLKNKENQIVSLYFRSTVNNENSKHFYLKNRQGLYPNYPKKETTKLILTESIIDAASFIQALANSQKALEYSILACYGTNGLNEEIQNAILDLKELEEIIFAFDNDQAGNEAVKKYANLLMSQFENLKISTIELPNKDVNETLQLHEPEIFTELLEKRNLLVESQKSKVESNQNLTSNISNLTTTIDFLKQDNLLNELNKQIGKSGIVGEENSRLLLFLIIISYMNKHPIHGIVQGSSGSGKTHLISKIADLMPQEDVLRFTRITESSLYNYGEFDLYQKIVIIEDLDGLKEDALYALRELISNQSLSSLTSIKDKKGNSKGARKEVKGQFSSLSATTKGELYEDNMNRSFILAINESEQQTQKIIDYQNKRIAGEIDLKEAPKAVHFIQKIVRNLKAYEVQNPYASKIQLPNNVRNKRRLNEMIQSVIKQITLLNQYQRRASAGNQLITEIEDIENAIEILFESIILKIDELDGSSRQFFEKLKKAFGEKDFTRFEAMEKTGFKKTQLQFYLNDLVRLEYLKQFGHHNKGYKYKVSYLDNNQQIRKELKAHFVQQLEAIKRTQANATEHQANAKTL